MTGVEQVQIIARASWMALFLVVDIYFWVCVYSLYVEYREQEEVQRQQFAIQYAAAQGGPYNPHLQSSYSQIPPKNDKAGMV